MTFGTISSEFVLKFVSNEFGLVCFDILNFPIFSSMRTAFIVSFFACSFNLSMFKYWLC